ncbi:reverse transcriptase [Senna tora]|uniref:Reverse transcriptase n=1 Tax=Senna tora TaxID=362788 RepID=A0A834TGQ0_9FABA|nr:reverse transcriptase [Senna tora]
MRRLEGIGRAMSQSPKPHLIPVEQELTLEYQKILSLKEELWTSKARLDWLNLGDSNTSFFHASVIKCRRSVPVETFPTEIRMNTFDQSTYNNLAAIPTKRNLAFLAKPCWRMEHEKENLWVKLTAHYLNSDLAGAFALGKGLNFDSDLLNLGPLNREEDKLLVNDFAEGVGVWNWEGISFDLPMQVQ